MPSHLEFLIAQRSSYFGATPPCLGDSYSPEDWRPVERDRVLFLRAAERVPVRPLARTSGSCLFAGRLHVVVSADRLIVTEADNLHEPGRVLTGIALVETAQRSVFRLTNEPPSGLEPARHYPVQGTATLTWAGGWRLQIETKGEGSTECPGLVIYARE